MQADNFLVCRIFHSWESLARKVFPIRLWPHRGHLYQRASEQLHLTPVVLHFWSLPCLKAKANQLNIFSSFKIMWLFYLLIVRFPNPLESYQLMANIEYFRYISDGLWLLTSIRRRTFTGPREMQEQASNNELCGKGREYKKPLLKRDHYGSGANLSR